MKTSKLYQSLPFIIGILFFVMLLLFPRAMKSQTDSCKIRGCYPFSNLDLQQIYGTLKQINSTAKHLTVTPTGTANVNVVNSPTVVVKGIDTLNQSARQLLNIGSVITLTISAVSTNTGTAYANAQCISNDTLSVKNYSIVIPSGSWEITNHLCITDYSVSMNHDCMYYSTSVQMTNDGTSYSVTYDQAKTCLFMLRYNWTNATWIYGGGGYSWITGSNNGTISNVMPSVNIAVKGGTYYMNSVSRTTNTPKSGQKYYYVITLKKIGAN